ncbi:unnamed protein product [Lactuca saligna]|uniref:RING-type E3 ubiquitin transferase (cysteine targeting) n=1 Tax=Lactuca saligna TaxID=75948 RepID=A0AA36EBP9_LACSI|nr:unnamed protein product [Lactuca saligna]
MYATSEHHLQAETLFTYGNRIILIPSSLISFNSFILLPVELFSKSAAPAATPPPTPEFCRHPYMLHPRVQSLHQLLYHMHLSLESYLWYWFSILVDKPTLGNALMNLRYIDERTMETRAKCKLVVSILGFVCNPYLLSASGVILNRYRNLIDRAIKARLVYGSPHMNRAVNFKYMNHQLVWNEFSEMLLLLLPILSSSSMKNFFIHSQNITIQALLEMKHYAPSARPIQQTCISPFLVNIGTLLNQNYLFVL